MISLAKLLKEFDRPWSSLLMVTFVFVFVGCLSIPAHGQSQKNTATEGIVVIDDNTAEYLLGPYIEYLEDKEGKWSFEDISSFPLSDNFTPRNQTIPNFGFSDSAYWVKLRIMYDGREEKEFIVEVGYPHLDDIEFYTDIPDQAPQITKTGDQYPFRQRNMKYRTFTFTVKTPPGRIHTVWFRVKTTSSVQIPLTLWTPKSLGEKINVEQFVFGCYYGVMLVMFFYNLFLFFSVRDTTYVCYIMYIVGFAGFQFIFNGFAHEWFWGDFPWWSNQAVMFSISFSVFWVIQFTQSLLRLRDHSRLADNILTFFKICSVVMMFLSLVLRYDVINKATMFLALSSSSACLVTGFVCWRKGVRAAYYFLIAWTVFLIGTIVVVLSRFGVLPSVFITNYASQIGSTLEVVLLSLALADRINSERKEKLAAQEKALENLKIAENLREDYTQNLEKEVANRTSELKQTRDYLENVFENSADAIVMVDRWGKFAQWNKAAIELFKHSGEVKAKNVFELYPNKDELRKMLTKLRAEGFVQGYPIEMQKMTGEIFPVELSISLLKNEKDETVGSVAVVRDLSELKKALGDAEIARQHAEAANHAKSAFLATMSHEIRTPMNGVIGLTGLLMATPLNSDQRAFAVNIKKSGDVLLTIINDILDFSKIEAEQLTLENAPFDLRECVESALNLVAIKGRDKGLEVSLRNEDGVPQTIMGDETRLRQILLNLLSNAVKFTHEGQITLSVSGTQISPLQDDSQNTHEIRFSVQDTGIGIPADRMDRLFKSFSQVDSSTSRKYGGTGLGLVISKRLTEMMGGQISVKSVDGKGTTFEFTIRTRLAECEKLFSYPPREKGFSHSDSEKGFSHSDSEKGFSHSDSEKGFSHSDSEKGFSHSDSEKGFSHSASEKGFSHSDSEKGFSHSAREKGFSHSDSEKGFSYSAREKGFSHSASENKFSHSDSAGDVDEGESEFDPGMAARFPLRILLAEDNSINQQLALLTLERFGYRADLAGNGLEAMNALGRQMYDVILMDIQMPEMDGMEATKRIRREFAPEKQPRIIAMTANAMQGDREMCLDAGMDDYIGKPFKVGELVAALLRCRAMNCGNDSCPSSKTVNPVAESSPAILDPSALDRLRTLLGGKADEMLPKLMANFCGDAGKLLEQARQSADCGDAETLRRAVHTLKSNAKNFGANALADLCQEAEDIAKAGKQEGISNLLARIETAFEIARTELNRRHT